MMPVHPLKRATSCSEPSYIQSQPQLKTCRFVYDILHGVDIIMAAAGPGHTSPEPASQPASSVDCAAPTLEIMIHVFNAGIVLPASSRSAFDACGLGERSRGIAYT